MPVCKAIDANMTQEVYTPERRFVVYWQPQLIDKYDVPTPVDLLDGHHAGRCLLDSFRYMESGNEVE